MKETSNIRAGSLWSPQEGSALMNIGDYARNDSSFARNDALWRGLGTFMGAKDGFEPGGMSSMSLARFL